MNAIANNKSLVATALVALLGAASLAFMHVEPAPEQQPEIVKLERVVINGKRAVAAEAAITIVQLPRVLVEGHRADAVQVAKAASCGTTNLC